jgi:cytochrome c oxidase assembly protein subunit 15
VAGLEAGYAFNTWPLMGEELFPEATPWMDPFLRNFVDNPIVVQFVHRWFAFVAAAAIGVLAWRAARAGMHRTAALVAGAVAFQIALGIATILTGVELWIGVAHQAMAALLLGAVLLAAHRLGRHAA